QQHMRVAYIEGDVALALLLLPQRLDDPFIAGEGLGKDQAAPAAIQGDRPAHWLGAAAAIFDRRLRVRPQTPQPMIERLFTAAVGVRPAGPGDFCHLARSHGSAATIPGGPPARVPSRAAA